jgi:hypothetical protein
MNYKIMALIALTLPALMQATNSVMEEIRETRATQDIERRLTDFFAKEAEIKGVVDQNSVEYKALRVVMSKYYIGDGLTTLIKAIFGFSATEVQSYVKGLQEQSEVRVQRRF